MPLARTVVGYCLSKLSSFFLRRSPLKSALRWRDTVLMRFMTLQMAISFLAKSVCADGVAVCALFVYR